MTPFYKYALWPNTMASDAYDMTPTEKLLDFRTQVRNKLNLTKEIKRRVVTIG